MRWHRRGHVVEAAAAMSAVAVAADGCAAVARSQRHRTCRHDPDEPSAGAASAEAETAAGGLARWVATDPNTYQDRAQAAHAHQRRPMAPFAPRPRLAACTLRRPRCHIHQTHTRRQSSNHHTCRHARAAWPGAVAAAAAAAGAAAVAVAAAVAQPTRATRLRAGEGAAACRPAPEASALQLARRRRSGSALAGRREADRPRQGVGPYSTGARPSPLAAPPQAESARAACSSVGGP